MATNPFSQSRKEAKRFKDEYALDMARVVETIDNSGHFIKVQTLDSDGEGPTFGAPVLVPIKGDINIPEEGDYVIVGYTRGRMPFILGTVYNKQDDITTHKDCERVLSHWASDAEIRFKCDGTIEIDGLSSTDFDDNIIYLLDNNKTIAFSTPSTDNMISKNGVIGSQNHIYTGLEYYLPMIDSNTDGFYIYHGLSSNKVTYSSEVTRNEIGNIFDWETTIANQATDQANGGCFISENYVFVIYRDRDDNSAYCHVLNRSDGTDLRNVNFGTGDVTSNSFNGACDANDNLYISSPFNEVFWKIDGDTGTVTSKSTSPKSADALWVDSDQNVWNSSTNEIRRYDTSLTLQETISYSRELGLPFTISWSGGKFEFVRSESTGKFAIENSGTFYIIEPDGTQTFKASSMAGLVADEDGNFIVVDTNYGYMSKIDGNGTILQTYISVGQNIRFTYGKGKPGAFPGNW